MDERFPCPVCRHGSIGPFMVVRQRWYGRCARCDATVLHPEQLPRRDAERARYEQHNNDGSDPGYVSFLHKLLDPLAARLSPGARVLDYGSGPAPVLAELMQQEGYTVAVYDPFFAPDLAPLAQMYDAITCCEVAEHFHRPAEELDRLLTMLQPGGILAVMTEFQTEDARFANWYYRQDPTHVVFYRESTWRQLAADRTLTIEIPRKNVALLQRAD